MRFPFTSAFCHPPLPPSPPLAFGHRPRPWSGLAQAFRENVRLSGELYKLAARDVHRGERVEGLEKQIQVLSKREPQPAADQRNNIRGKLRQDQVTPHYGSSHVQARLFGDSWGETACAQRCTVKGKRPR